MPRIVSKTLTFPMAGVVRRGMYREQARPYAAPWAVNVRGICSVETRRRGGSRPGLLRVLNQSFGDVITALLPITYIDEDGERQHDLIVVADGSFSIVRGATVTETEAQWLTAAGDPIQTAAGENIYFNAVVSSVNPGGDTNAFDAIERNGKLYLADSVLREYNPVTGVVSNVQASAGSVPEGQPLVTLYRDRLFLAGENHLWYASRQSDPTDWHFGADMGDTGRAVAGHISEAGSIGEIVQAMIPVKDAALIFASRHDLWLLRGDPAEGTMVRLTEGIGILSPTAWAMAPDGMIAFLSSDGVYLMGAGSTEAPTRFSADRLPEELRNIDPEGETIVMAYDVRDRGFHLFLTPETGSGQHWWLDIENRAVWPVKLPDGMQPVAVARVQGTSELSDCVMGCRDGILRKFDDDSEDDDGTEIRSHVLIGPVRLPTDDLSDSVLNEIHGMLADTSGIVRWRVLTGKDAETVVQDAVGAIETEMDGDMPDVSFAGGEWRDGRNRVARPRTRGAWVVVWLSSTSRWAFEAIALRINQLGRLR